MKTDLTDKQIIRLAQNAGFDDLAIHYETEKLTAFARAIIAADRAQRDAAPQIILSQLEAMLINSRVIDHDAIHDAETYDDGVMRNRVYNLWQRLIKEAPQAQPEQVLKDAV